MKTLELVHQAINGDKQAFQQLIGATRPKLERIAGYYVKNEHDAADIVQEAVFKAYLAIYKLKNPNYFSTWMTRIVINCALDFLKKQKRPNPLSKKEELIVYPSFDMQLYMKEAIAKLTEKQRQVIVLKYFEDLTIQEIANMLDAPLGTVKTYLHKGLEQLRKELHVVQGKSPKVTQRKLSIEGAIKVVKDKLKNRALTILEIPEHFSPVIEDYFENEKDKGEAFFTWSTKDEEENIEITLNQDGDLLSLTLDMKEIEEERVEIILEERQKKAEAFLLDHYPDALQILQLFEEKKLENNVIRYDYEQLVFDLPLALAGCYIDVNNKGDIVNFRYHGIKPVPNIPKKLVVKEVLVEKLRKQLAFELKLVNFTEGVYDSFDKGLRLVYEPTPSYMRFRADELEPSLRIDEEDDVEKYIPLAAPETKMIRNRSNEEIIGVTSDMELIREVDFGSEVGKVWRDRSWQGDHEDLSLNGYFERQNEETVKAFINKETGKVTKFMWFKKRKGSLQLTREECMEKAAEFLQRMIPDYHLYLELLVQEFDKDDEDNNQGEFFTFKVKSQNGYQVFLEIIHITVNRTTGDIDHYNGLSFDAGLLKKVPSEPSISKEEARKTYFDHLDFQLSWQKSYDSEEEKQYLEYKACAKDSKKEIRYIDALTGKLISWVL